MAAQRHPVYVGQDRFADLMEVDDGGHHARGGGKPPNKGSGQPEEAETGQQTSDGRLHLTKGSLPNTLPFLRVDCRTNTLYKICLPNTLPFLRVVEQILKANNTSFYSVKVDDLYLYPLFADPKVLKKCCQSVAG